MAMKVALYARVSSESQDVDLSISELKYVSNDASSH